MESPLHSAFSLAGASQVALVVETPPANAGDTRGRLIHESGGSPGGGHGNPLQCSCLENPMNRGAWWAAVHGVTKSRTRLKRLGKHVHSLISILYIVSIVYICHFNLPIHNERFLCFWRAIVRQFLLHHVYITRQLVKWQLACKRIQPCHNTSALGSVHTAWEALWITDVESGSESTPRFKVLTLPS